MPVADNIAAIRLHQQLGRVRKTPGRVPKQDPAVRRRLMEMYYRALVTDIDELRAMVMREIVPFLGQWIADAERERSDSSGIRLDAGKRARNTLDRIKAAAEAKGPTNRAKAERAADVTQRTQKQQLGRQVKSAIGIDINDILRNERGLQARIEAFVAVNVGKIKTNQDTYLAHIDSVVMDAIRTGARNETLAKTLLELSKEMGRAHEMSVNRAKLIARDQLGKFYGALNESRQTALGIEEYVWRWSHNTRNVREEHMDRDGDVYRWDDPPEDGPPGEAIQCGCTAEPRMENVMAILSGKATAAA